MDLSGFERIVFFTGAGMSAESGVPTYRGRGGIWHEYNYEDYACQQAFERDPRKVWDFHDLRREKVGACQPHAGHFVIAELEKRPDKHVTVVTQNIDGMHQRAGSLAVKELHGSMWRIRCDHCDRVTNNRDVPLQSYQHECGNWWRPDITWFGDSLHPGVVRSALAAISTCQLLVSVGTSAVVYPAAEFPLQAKRGGARLIEINPEDTALSDIYDERIRESASTALTRLFG